VSIVLLLQDQPNSVSRELREDSIDVLPIFSLSNHHHHDVPSLFVSSVRSPPTQYATQVEHQMALEQLWDAIKQDSYADDLLHTLMKVWVVLDESHLLEMPSQGWLSPIHWQTSPVGWSLRALEKCVLRPHHRCLPLRAGCTGIAQAPQQSCEVYGGELQKKNYPRWSSQRRSHLHQGPYG
jgi:hypothetical protein